MNTAYEAYLHSPEWAERRQHKLAEVGYRCQGCGDDECLQVHHLSYRCLGHERPEELMVLCWLCHAKEHGRTPDVGPIAGRSMDEIHAEKRALEVLQRTGEQEIGCARLLVAVRRLRIKIANAGLGSPRIRKLLKSVEHDLRREQTSLGDPETHEERKQRILRKVEEMEAAWQAWSEEPTDLGVP